MVKRQTKHASCWQGQELSKLGQLELLGVFRATERQRVRGGPRPGGGVEALVRTSEGGRAAAEGPGRAARLDGGEVQQVPRWQVADHRPRPVHHGVPCAGRRAAGPRSRGLGGADAPGTSRPRRAAARVGGGRTGAAAERTRGRPGRPCRRRGAAAAGGGGRGPGAGRGGAGRAQGAAHGAVGVTAGSGPAPGARRHYPLPGRPGHQCAGHLLQRPRQRPRPPDHARPRCRGHRSRAGDRGGRDRGLLVVRRPNGGGERSGPASGGRKRSTPGPSRSRWWWRVRTSIGSAGGPSRWTRS